MGAKFLFDQVLDGRAGSLTKRSATKKATNKTIDKTSVVMICGDPQPSVLPSEMAYVNKIRAAVRIDIPGRSRLRFRSLVTCGCLGTMTMAKRENGMTEMAIR